MTSSMLSGDRRWASSSSRRGGMTVLGKVAVPKPINLPSQRLENHGLDPNVEIVPNWGSKSSSASNAWGSSSLSPNTDGGSSSPSHLSARPSSGGSGTRPSTAGSDRALEPNSNAWGSNSRPSSASGSLTTNQASLPSLRPRSAETRPGSSQLSRFAESLTENPVAWSSSRAADKLGAKSEFSLSSGDFPTLGSEKDKSLKNSELQDHSSHGRPGSSSGHGKEKAETVDDVSVDANVMGGAVNSWGGDHQTHSDDGMKPSMEKWQGNPHPYPSAGIGPQHYDAWHVPPVNNPQGGVWFRGPPGGPPFGSPVTPGGFPIEPFSYYRPHIPPTGLVNPPTVPPPGAGPRGPHPKNGDAYRPHMPDSYIRPGMPIRAGFYPGPMAYDGYYSAPMGYCNSNDRDVPFMGMSAGLTVYSRYSVQNPSEPGNLQGRSGGCVSSGKQSSKQGESSHPPDTGGPYRVLLKQNNAWDGKNEPSNWEESETVNAYVERRDNKGLPVWDNEQKTDSRVNEEMNSRAGGCGDEVLQTSENRGSSFSVKADHSDSSGNIKTSNDTSARKLDRTASGGEEVPSRSVAPKESSLIQKIEGLNAKARDNSSAKSREEQRNKFYAANAPVNHVENGVVAGDMLLQRKCTPEVLNPTLREVSASGGEKNLESLSFRGTESSRRAVHGIQGRADHRSKGRFNNQDADEWRQKSVDADSTPSSSQLEASDVHIGDHRISIETYDRSGSYHQARHDGESVQSMSDPIATQAQRAKIKELAKQRTKQLQEEEEERIRKQKAKALAKLDELNRRAQEVEGSNYKENATSSALKNKTQESQASESANLAGKSGASMMCSTNSQISVNGTNQVGTSLILSVELPSEKLDTGKESVPNQSVTLHQDVYSAEATGDMQVLSNIAAKQRRVGYKQKQNLSSNEKLISATPAASKVENGTVIDAGSPGIVANEVYSAGGLTIVAESSVNQKRKNNNKNGKNKHKVEESPSFAASLPLATPKEANFSRSSVESDHPKASNFELNQDSVLPASLSKDPNQHPEQSRNSSNEESHGRLSSQWKSQHSRRMPRNMQANRPTEKSHGNDTVIWAPVKHQNKMEIADESAEKSKFETVNSVKVDQQVHGNFKNKRAEMERYIPKPAAKEMAQQGSVQQVASSINERPTDEFVGRVVSASQGGQISQHTSSPVVKVASGMESKNGDVRQTKQGKTHGSWRQRGSTESTNVHDAEEGLHSDPNNGQNLQRSTERQQAQKSDMSSVKGQTKHVNDSIDPDGSHHIANQDPTAQPSAPAVKDQAVTGRGRRGPSRGHRVMGMNHDIDHKKHDREAEKIELQISSSEPGQPDVGAALKENRSVGERLTAHWQPKSQASSSQQGSRPNYRNVCPEASQAIQKDSTHGSLSHPGGPYNETDSHTPRPHSDQSDLEKGKAGGATNIGNQEAKRESRNAPPKGRSHSPSQVIVSSVEPPPTSVDFRPEQRLSSGFRGNGNQNRFGRGHESRGDWKSSGQDNRHYNQLRERQGHSLQYEYHPVGLHDNSKSDNPERPKDSNYNGGRYRERSQTHSRRGGGNFYGRQGGSFD
ncbi:protein MODIFIER OF SNC1 1 isoform X2 [Prosopis cineraria]|uniref:protein MODIFIER OF SNC1 1 isoform X2 n=1 Tax=Prosopis cineraria TaxID=364024 RepID=UPI00240F323F|nr:protein MODIFIER OF SNC1 1 isoform X2 [Prosopis cineraria]